MITRVWSSLPLFRDVNFRQGMNVVLADQVDDADEMESTNGLGKTTLLRIIQFCLGSDLSKDKALSHPRLDEVSFGLAFIFGEQEIEVVRSTKHSKVVYISQSFLTGTEYTSTSVTDGRHKLSLETWRALLSLQFMRSGQADLNTPSFREIALFLIRIGKPAFSKPTIAFERQPGSFERACVSYLLGLNWSSQRKLQELTDKRKHVKAAIKALANVESVSEQKAIGDLEADRVALEAAIEAKRIEIENFNVREDYQDLQTRLAETDRTLHGLVNDNHIDERLLRHYVKSAGKLPQADKEKSISILKNAGAIFRDEALKRIEEVAAFHAEVHKNRAKFLKGEVDRLRDIITHRNAEVDKLADKKTSILQLLKTSGAFETLIELQESYNEQSIRYEALMAQLTQRRKFDRKDDELLAELSNERYFMKRDLEDRQGTVDEARLLFAEYTQFLYGAPGGLGVHVKPAGYTFNFSIDREGSDGVDQMVVFCFDLTVATLQARRGTGFRTLIHDSTLFADVDQRQYGLALQLAMKTADAEGFQYICCLNAGALPKEHLGNLDLEAVTRLRLTDEGNTGRLLGMRLPPRHKAG